MYLDSFFYQTYPGGFRAILDVFLEFGAVDFGLIGLQTESISGWLDERFSKCLARAFAGGSTKAVGLASAGKKVAGQLAL